MYLHRVRADVLPGRRGAISVRTDGRSRDVRDGVLVHPLAHARADHGEVSAQAPRRGRTRATALVQSVRALSAPLRAGFLSLSRWVSRSAAACARASSAVRDRLHDLRARILPARSISRPQFLPDGRLGTDPDSCACTCGYSCRSHRGEVRRDSGSDSSDHSAARDPLDGRQRRHAVLGHQSQLQQHGPDRLPGWRHSDRTHRGPWTDSRLRAQIARRAAAPFSRRAVLVHARGHRESDPEFRGTRADRSADPRTRSQGELCVCGHLARAAAQDSGNRRCAHPAIAQHPRVRGQRRSHARSVRGPHRA